MLRITDLNGIFLRDDFTFDETTEIGLSVEPAQGIYRPRWNGEAWEEALTPAKIEAIKASAVPPEPTLDEIVTATETKVVTIEQTIDTLFGGV